MVTAGGKCKTYRVKVPAGVACFALPALLARGVSAEPAVADVPPPSADQPPAAPSLDYVECAGLDVAETERLLRVELAVIAARVERARAPSVRIECKRGVLYIEVEDPASGGKKALTLPAPGAKTVDRERTVAIAASQLFLSSWLEMITGQKPPEPPPRRARKPPPPQPPPPPPVRRVDTGPSPARDDTGWELLASGALRWRHLGRAVPTIGPSLVLRRRFMKRWLLQGELGVETAETARASGDIDWLGSRAGAGFGLRIGSRPWSLDALLSGSLMVVRADGVPGRDGVRGSDSTAAAFDLSLGVVPQLSFSRFRLGLLLEAGVLYPELTGRVSQERPASLHGPWAGLGIVIGGEIAP